MLVYFTQRVPYIFALKRKFRNLYYKSNSYNIFYEIITLAYKQKSQAQSLAFHIQISDIAKLMQPSRDA